MFEVDYARGFAYKKDKGFLIKLDREGLYIMYGLKKVHLTEKNTKPYKEYKKDKNKNLRDDFDGKKNIEREL